MKSHQISAFCLLMTVLLSSTLADEWLHEFCEAGALQEPPTPQQGTSSMMRTTADHSLLTSSHKEDRQSRLAASPARPEAAERKKVDELIVGDRRRVGAAASTETADRYGLGQCCFTYFTGRLRMDLITGYEETRADCAKPGTILYIKKGKELCVDPSNRWVQNVKQKLDQQ